MKNLTSVCVALTLLSVTYSDVSAQGLDEITVTATRREASVQDLPVSVSAFSEKMMESLALNEANELASHTPGLTINQGFSATAPIFALRGISNFGFTSNFTGSVAVYTDEVILNNNVAHGVQMFDLERVEVLKGPQGTLYGANTTGGAVNFIANKPGGELASKIDVTVAEFGEIGAKGYVNAPVGEAGGFRLAVLHRQNDGYLKDLSTGEDRQFIDQTSVRAQLALDPSDSVSVLLRADYSQNDGDASYGTQLGTLDPNGGLPTAFDAVFLIPVGFTRCDDARILAQECVDMAGYSLGAETSDVYAGRYDVTGGTETSDSWGLTSTIDWAVGEGSFRSLTHYREDNRDYLEDTDAGPFDLVTSQFDSESSQFSQEIRYTSDPAQSVRYIAGLFYLEDEVSSFFPTFSYRTLPDSLANLPLIDAFGIITGVPGTEIAPTTGTSGAAQGFFNLIDQDTESFAVFLDGSVDVNEKFTISAGLRYSDESKKATSLYQDIGFPGLALDVNVAVTPSDVVGTGFFMDRTVVDSSDEQEVTGRLAFEYSFSEDVLGYASYSRSFKGGNVNGLSLGFGPSDGLFLEPEYVDGFEAGVKSTLLDGRARLNSAVYYYEFEGQQLNSTLNQSAVLTNIDTSEILGFEANLQLQATDRLYLQAGASIINAEYGNFINNRGRDLTGFEMARTPPWELNLLGEYVAPLQSGASLAFQADVAIRDEMYMDPGRPELSTIPSVTMLGANIAYTSPSERFRVALWGKNLLDEEVYFASIDLTDFSGSALRLVAPPSVMGITFTFQTD